MRRHEILLPRSQIRPYPFLLQEEWFNTKLLNNDRTFAEWLQLLDVIWGKSLEGFNGIWWLCGCAGLLCEGCVTQRFLEAASQGWLGMLETLAKVILPTASVGRFLLVFWSRVVVGTVGNVTLEQADALSRPLQHGPFPHSSAGE